MKEDIINKPKHVLSEREKVKKVTIFLNSGQIFHIYCKEAEFKVSQATGEVKSYIFTGVRQPQLVNIRVDAIAAYTIMETRI